MAGRPPKPIEEHLTDGTYQPCRHDGRGVELEKVADIVPPAGLGSKATKVWKQILPELCSAGLVSRVDYPALEEAFVAYAEGHDALHTLRRRRRELQKRIRELTNEDSLDPDRIDQLEELSSRLVSTQRVMMREFRQDMELFNWVMVRFGMTPVERAKLRTPAKKKTGSGMERILDA